MEGVEKDMEKFPVFDEGHWEREGGARETGVNAVWKGFWEEVTFHLSREDYLRDWIDE